MLKTFVVSWLSILYNLPIKKENIIGINSTSHLTKYHKIIICIKQLQKKIKNACKHNSTIEIYLNIGDKKYH